MRKSLLFVLSFMLIAACSFAQQVYPGYQDGKIWFKIKAGKHIDADIKEDPHNIDMSAMSFLGSIRKDHQLTKLSKPFFAAKRSDILLRTYLLEFSDISNVEQIIAALKASDMIEYAEKVPLDKICYTPNDPSYSSQWGLTTINASGAWNYFNGNSNIVVAIVDNAVQRSHPDLQPSIWVNTGEIANNNIDDDGNGYIDDVNGWDVASNDNNPDPPSTSFDHGTHVAGIAGAKTNNSTGIASIGFSVKIMPIKAATTSTAISNGYDGIVYAAENGARVINCSWGGSTSSTTAQNVINYAYSLGAIIVAAAGNSNVNTMFYPAAYNNVISVAATQSNDAKASFSNYGSWIDISAPGNNIYSTIPNSTYGNMSGTSMASPMVAGLAGLMLSLNPSLTQADITNCILSTADNINSQNPSYIGQLGAGRINASNAMNCVSATLNWAPVADFAANFTTVTAGGSVTFTNLSLYNPTSWSWSFPGGTPSSYNGQNPPAITYNTPGTYNVSLTVTNANGTDTETKTGYITVNASGGCYSINYPVPSGWTLTNYYTGGPPVGAGGWINGVNQYLDKQKAMYFDASAQPYTYMVSTYIAFGRAYSATPSKIVPVKVYDGTSGSPGALLATENLTMQQIMSDVSNSYYTEVIFSNPVTLPASKKFFVAVDLTNLQWQTGVHDTLSIVSNQNGQTTPSPVWEQQSSNTWYQYGTAGSWNLNVSLIMHPFLTNQPTVATMTSSATTICSGNTITFDATGSTYQDTLLWVFPNGSPGISNNVSQSVLFNTPGTYTVKVYVVGGGCSMLDSAQATITVNPTPAITLAASPGTTICNSGSVTLTASGASTYTWSPATALSSTTGASVVATPTSSITYNVTGTQGACSNSSSISINVEQAPVANVSTTATTICVGQTVTFDGSLSTDVNSFSWSFPGGTPSTSTASTPTVQFNTAGTYTVTLTAAGNCGTDSSYSQVINVGCVGIDEAVANNITSFYNPLSGKVEISVKGAGEGSQLRMVNTLGQLIYSEDVTAAAFERGIDMSGYAKGVYSVAVVSGSRMYISRFVKQ